MWANWAFDAVRMEQAAKLPQNYMAVKPIARPIQLGPGGAAVFAEKA